MEVQHVNVIKDGVTYEDPEVFVGNTKVFPSKIKVFEAGVVYTREQLEFILSNFQSLNSYRLYERRGTVTLNLYGSSSPKIYNFSGTSGNFRYEQGDVGSGTSATCVFVNFSGSMAPTGAAGMWSDLIWNGDSFSRYAYWLLQGVNISTGSTVEFSNDVYAV